MSRAKRSVHARKKRRDTLARAKGYRGQASKSYKRAKEALLKADSYAYRDHRDLHVRSRRQRQMCIRDSMKADSYAYRDRRNRKRDFRRLWIVRINACLLYTSPSPRDRS